MWKMKLIFCLKISRKVFNKLIVLLLGVHSHACPKYPTGLQYLKENVKDKVDFLPKNKDERFFQIHIIVVGLCSQACPNYPK